jgi:hypothetical protein
LLTRDSLDLLDIDAKQQIKASLPANRSNSPDFSGSNREEHSVLPYHDK